MIEIKTKKFILPSITAFLVVLTGFISGKLVALNLGIDGMASYGLLLNIAGLFYSFANGGINYGIVSLAALNQENAVEKNQFISKLITQSLISSFFLTLIVLITASKISYAFLGNASLSIPIKFLGITIFFAGINNTIISYINGIGNFKLLTILKISQSLLMLISLFILTFLFPKNGVFFSISLSQILLVILIIIFSKKIFLNIKIGIKYLDPLLLRQLFRFSIISISTAIVAPFFQVLQRNIIIHNLSLRDAGLWQSMLRISDGYMLFFTMIISYVYLPKINTCKEYRDYTNLISEVFKPLLFGALILFFFIFIFSTQIVNFFFTPLFIDLIYLLPLQLIGDFLKIIAFIFLYIVIARGDFKRYVFIEVIFAGGQLCLSYLLTLNGCRNSAVASYAIVMLVQVLYLFYNRKIYFT